MDGDEGAVVVALIALPPYNVLSNQKNVEKDSRLTYLLTSYIPPLSSQSHNHHSTLMFVNILTWKK